MAAPDLEQIYSSTRRTLSALVSDMSEQDLARPVPATPGWSIRDVVAHLAGAAERTAAGDFPAEFFAGLGTEEGVAVVNEWTGRQVTESRARTIQEVLDAWERSSDALGPMLRGDLPWPDGVVPFASYVFVTDVTVHQHDVYGALGIRKDRDAPAIGIGFSIYVTGADLRLRASGGPSLRLVTETKEKLAGDGEPVATVRASRFELFRALSGRRNPDQLRAYEWDGDPEPFLELFYPYGVREEALVE